MCAFLPVVRNLPQAYGLLKTCRVWSPWHWPAPSGLQVAPTWKHTELYASVLLKCFQTPSSSFGGHSSFQQTVLPGTGVWEAWVQALQVKTGTKQAPSMSTFSMSCLKSRGQHVLWCQRDKASWKNEPHLNFGTTKNNKFQLEIYSFSVCPSLLCIVNKKLFILSSKLVELILNAIHTQVLSIGVHFTSLCCCINPF